MGDLGSIPGLGRSPGGGHGNPLQYSCLKNPWDRVAWQATVQGVSKRWTCLSNLQFHFQMSISTVIAKGFLHGREPEGMRGPLRRVITGCERPCALGLLSMDELEEAIVLQAPERV